MRSCPHCGTHWKVVVDVRVERTDDMPWEQLVQLVQRPPLEDMEVDESVAADRGIVR